MGTIATLTESKQPEHLKRIKSRLSENIRLIAVSYATRLGVGECLSGRARSQWPSRSEKVTLQGSVS